MYTFSFLAFKFLYLVIPYIQCSVVSGHITGAGGCLWCAYSDDWVMCDD